MFDLITGTTKHLPQVGRGALLGTVAFHASVLGALVIVPALVVTDVLPPVQTMAAFVVELAAQAPHPLPPPPASRVLKAAEARIAIARQAAAPVEAPLRIDPEPETVPGDQDEGVEGGVEGGIPGGVAVGGLVGGLDAPPPPPPPPPAPAPAPVAPRRVGGEIRPPVLLHRVEPIYPEIAVRARVEGMVILEALIDENGDVQQVKVLRSVSLLERAAVTAVEQWRYSPVLLNGRLIPVLLTVTVTFRIPVP